MANWIEYLSVQKSVTRNLRGYMQASKEVIMQHQITATHTKTHCRPQMYTEYRRAGHQNHSPSDSPDHQELVQIVSCHQQAIYNYTSAKKDGNQTFIFVAGQRAVCR